MTTLMQWFRYLWVLIRKEFLAILADPANRVTLIAPVFIQAVLFGYAASYDVNHVDYAVLDQSRSQSSQQVLAHLDGSGIFSVHDKFHRTLILSGFCLLKIAKISLNSSFFPKPIKR